MVTHSSGPIKNSAPAAKISRVQDASAIAASGLTVANTFRLHYHPF
ncbi:hypothetical protein ML401_02690 [Bradyrhizobium sp. 62B]|jgi:hypothetical protein|nr:hypothetical protein [Bradyrhizobium sp. CCBAU 53351]MCS3761714.1 hypothetical protein [Bradyrhizobium centrosematis]MCS3774382.1 hypothetical protein [Bradyrhizobium centrosematis]WIW47048.1 hypothetical protein ML401_02690 [Bradyrhizobium sp. 62B]